MSIILLGRKIGMTQIFDGGGNLVPVTVLKLGPCKVLRHKRADGKDGYNAVVLGFEEIAPRKVIKPVAGQFAKLGTEPMKVVKEIRVEEEEFEKYPVGEDVTLQLFNRGDKVDVIGWSKGRGYQGVMKRHGFHGAPASHGAHEYKRHGGSIGNAEFPGRVVKGRKMAGQMGNERVTVLNLKVDALVPRQNLMLVKGAVPGARGGLVMVRKAVKVKKRKVRGFAAAAK